MEQKSDDYVQHFANLICQQKWQCYQIHMENWAVPKCEIFSIEAEMQKDGWKRKPQ